MAISENEPRGVQFNYSTIPQARRPSREICSVRIDLVNDRNKARFIQRLYALPRDPSKVDALRAATNPDFAWTPAADAPPGLPLFLLMPADCRRAAAQLSLGQAIAGDGAFSFGMVADFEAMIRVHGPWFYRRLFWEAGMIGQVLYLEAEAAAIRLGNRLRSTGIGAYFDDPVHEAFGLSGHQFQSIYHFTMGGAVDDTRLTTRSPYDEAVTLRT